MQSIRFILATFTALIFLGCSKENAKPNPLVKRVVIIHGYAATPDDHWFQWLKTKAVDEGMEVSIINLPNPSNPNIQDWLNALGDQVSFQPDEHTYFVAHSLGSVTLMRYLQNLPQQTKIGGYILVSGFSSSLPILPQLDPFTSSPLDFDRLKSITDSRIVVGAKDDSIVPFPLIKSFSNSLNADLIETKSGGHFLKGDGYSEFPLVWENLKSITKKQ